MPRWNAKADGAIDVVDALTGEAIDATEIADSGDVEWVAGAIVALDRLAGRVKAVRVRLDAAMEEARVRGDVSSADIVGGVKVPRKLSRRWNPDRTIAALDRLVEAGVIAGARASRLAPMAETVKPDGKALVQLLGELDDDTRETLRSACSELVRWEAEEVAP